VRSRSLVYIVNINAEGIQENVSVAATWPDALLLISSKGEGTYRSKRDSTSLRELAWIRFGSRFSDLCNVLRGTRDSVFRYERGGGYTIKS